MPASSGGGRAGRLRSQDDDEHEPEDDGGDHGDRGRVPEQLPEEDVLVHALGVGDERPVRRERLTSTMVDETARAATNPTAPTPVPPSRNGTASGMIDPRTAVDEANAETIAPIGAEKQRGNQR